MTTPELRRMDAEVQRLSAEVKRLESQLAESTRNELAATRLFAESLRGRKTPFRIPEYILRDNKPDLELHSRKNEMNDAIEYWVTAATAAASGEE